MCDAVTEDSGRSLGFDNVFVRQRPWERECGCVSVLGQVQASLGAPVFHSFLHVRTTLLSSFSSRESRTVASERPGWVGLPIAVGHRAI